MKKIFTLIGDLSAFLLALACWLLMLPFTFRGLVALIELLHV